MLNSDGEVEADGETHAERHARTVASATQVGSSGLRSRPRWLSRLKVHLFS